MWPSARLSVRSLRRSPGNALACTLTLALGAGATTSALALLNGVVLKPLPVERPRELVLFSDDTRDGVVFTGTPQETLILFSTPSFDYQRAHQQTFTGVAAFQIGRDRVAARVDDAAELATVTRVSPNYFSVLGVRAQAGRLFDASDDRGGGLPAVVMSDACGVRRFQRDLVVIGRRVTVGTTSYTIAGVAARSFYDESQLQNGALGGRLVVRTGGDSLAVTTPLRDLIRRAAPNLPITKMTTLDEEIRVKTATERALAMTATALGPRHCSSPPSACAP